jgi:hypothetical protein
MEFNGPRRNTETIMGRSVVIFSPSEVLPVAESTGFNAAVIEKVLHLLNLLNKLNSHSFLKGKLALKGGSALNLFVFNIPRLSVDIDLNYIGALDREKMMVDRPKVEKAVEAVFAREGFTVKRKPIEHAGGKWRLWSAFCIRHFIIGLLFDGLLIPDLQGTLVREDRYTILS